MMNETLAQQLKYLRLPGLLARWDEHLNAAAQSNLSHARLLSRVIEEEYRLKCEQARQQRLKLAKIPEKWVMDTFPAKMWGVQIGATTIRKHVQILGAQARSEERRVGKECRTQGAREH